MGCSGSRLDEDGMGMPPKSRPVFLHELKMRRHMTRPSHKDAISTPSKKELLLYDKDDDGSSTYKNAPQTARFSPKGGGEGEGTNKHEDDRKHKDVRNVDVRGKGGRNGHKVNKSEISSAGDGEEDEDYDERMIGRAPGSPSFRVYFNDGGEDIHNDIGKHDDFKSGGAVSSEESAENKAQRGTKEKSF